MRKLLIFIALFSAFCFQACHGSEGRGVFSVRSIEKSEEIMSKLGSSLSTFPAGILCTKDNILEDLRNSELTLEAFEERVLDRQALCRHVAETNHYRVLLEADKPVLSPSPSGVRLQLSLIGGQKSLLVRAGLISEIHELVDSMDAALSPEAHATLNEGLSAKVGVDVRLPQDLSNGEAIFVTLAYEAIWKKGLRQNDAVYAEARRVGQAVSQNPRAFLMSFEERFQTPGKRPSLDIRWHLWSDQYYNSHEKRNSALTQALAQIEEIEGFEQPNLSVVTAGRLEGYSRRLKETLRFMWNTEAVITALQKVERTTLLRAFVRRAEIAVPEPKFRLPYQFDRGDNADWLLAESGLFVLGGWERALGYNESGTPQWHPVRELPLYKESEGYKVWEMIAEGRTFNDPKGLVVPFRGEHGVMTHRWQLAALASHFDSESVFDLEGDREKILDLSRGVEQIFTPFESGCLAQIPTEPEHTCHVYRAIGQGWFDKNLTIEGVQTKDAHDLWSLGFDAISLPPPLSISATPAFSGFFTGRVMKVLPGLGDRPDPSLLKK